MTARTLIPLLSACLLNALAAPCPAQPAVPPAARLTVHLGWGDKAGGGRWAPVFVTASGPKPLATVVEVYALGGGTDAMRVRQFLTIGPVPATVALYVPLQFNGPRGPTVVLSDEATGKTLAHYPPDPDSDDFIGRLVNTAGTFIGVSGQPTVLQGLTDALPAARLETGYLDPDLLPATTVGYDELDLLVLNRPDLLHLSGGRQQAIVDWVRAGGNLLLWPGEDPAPRSGPLIDALPCHIAGGRNATIPEAELRRLGLPRRFADVRGRQLQPLTFDPSDPPAEPIRLFDDSDDPDNFAYRRRLGLGHVLVTPVDLSELQFNDAGHAGRFWGPLLAGMSVLPQRPGDAGNAPPPPASPRLEGDPDLARQYAAGRVLEQFLGGQDDPPGASASTGTTGDRRSGLPDFAAVLLGFMVVAGPVDWFVLRRLGRRSWTWVTTTAWLVLLVGGGMYLGHLFKSRPLSYQSVRVIDQTDRGEMAETSLVRIDPPRTAVYHLDSSTAGAPADGADPAQPATGWWSVVGAEDDGSRHGLIHDITFHQTDRGNAPDPMRLEATSRRFLRQEATRDGPALVDVSLSISTAPGGAPHVKGSIHNRSAKALSGVRVRTKHGTTPPLPSIEPGASAAVDADIETGPAAPFAEGNADPASRYARDPSAVTPAVLWQVAGDLAAGRSRRIDELLNRDQFVCVYAEAAPPDPPAVLRGAGDVAAGRKHYELIRAVARVTREGATDPNP